MKRYISLNEFSFDKLVKESVKKILKENTVDELRQNWDRAATYVGYEEMLDELYKFLYEDVIESFLYYVDEKYSLDLDIFGNKNYEDETENEEDDWEISNSQIGNYY